MSKIALTPNATGTGVFTISSPATNTNRTLTLPDEAGTVLTSASSLASANLTGTVTVSGGNVGIGTALPTQLLSIYGSGGTLAGTAAISLWDGNSGSSRKWAIANGASATGTSQIGALTFSVGSGSFTADPLTAGIEAMRIDSSGNVLVGTTDSVPYNNSAGSTADNGIALGATGIISSAKYNDNCAAFNRTGTDGGIISFRKSGGNCGSISVTASSTAYNTSSDYRLKTDAQPMTGASARVLALKPVNFEWITDGSRVDGFLAHEAQAIVPECVTGTKDAMRDEQYEVTAAVYEDIIIAAVLDEEGNELEAERTEQRLVTEAVMGTRSVPDMQGIDQSKLVPLLTAALQEALNKIEAMETRLAALEAV
jgi:hypothetical protein